MRKSTHGGGKEQRGCYYQRETVRLRTGCGSERHFNIFTSVSIVNLQDTVFYQLKHHFDIHSFSPHTLCIVFHTFSALNQTHLFNIVITFAGTKDHHIVISTNPENGVSCRSLAIEVVYGSWQGSALPLEVSRGPPLYEALLYSAPSC